MNEMVERVTRAIAKALHRDPDATLDSGNPTWSAYVPVARAVIAAMREPTMAMDIAGNGAMDNGPYRSRLAEWHAMIDAALNDSKRGPHDEVLERLNAGDLWGAMARAARGGD